MTINCVINGDYSRWEGKEHASMVTKVGASLITMVATEGIEAGPKSGYMETMG